MAIHVPLAFQMAHFQTVPFFIGLVHPTQRFHSTVNYNSILPPFLTTNNVVFPGDKKSPQIRSAVTSGWSWATFFPAYFTILSPSFVYAQTSANAFLPAVEEAAADLEESPSSLSSTIWLGSSTREAENVTNADKGRSLPVAEIVLNATRSPLTVRLRNYIGIKILPGKNADQALFSEAIKTVTRLSIVKVLDDAAVLWDENYRRREQQRFPQNTSSNLTTEFSRQNPFVIDVHRLPNKCWTIDFPRVQVVDSRRLETFVHNSSEESSRHRLLHQMNLVKWVYQIYDSNYQMVAEDHCVNRYLKKLWTPGAESISSRQRNLAASASISYVAVEESLLKPGDTIVFYPVAS